MVAAAIYLIVPPFVPLLVRLGDDLPVSSRILIAAYRFAVVLPVGAAAAGAAGARLVVPATYAVAAGVLGFVALALSVALFELS